ncbi:MAG: TA system antitoxin ParD family protein [Acidobacteriaceae bacterium]
MSQPVKLSDALVLDARLAGETVERSIAGQVEFWARLGRSVDLLLEGQQALKLCRSAAIQPLSACLTSVDTPAGRKRVTAYLQVMPFPHYRPHPQKPGLLERIDEDGTRTLGRFVNRQFKPVRGSVKTGVPVKARAAR